MDRIVRRVPVALRWLMVVAIISVSGSTVTPALAETQSIEVWWPAEGAAVSGSQPFKALLTNKTLKEYRMYWQVNGGKLNEMANSFEDHPHKESVVDLNAWPGEGPYLVDFIAKNKGGNELARRTVTIEVTQPSAPPTTLPSTTTSTTTTTPPTTTTTAPTTTTTTPTTTTTTISHPASVLAGATLYVDPWSPAKAQADAIRADNPNQASLLDKIAGASTAKWFGDWNGDIFAAVDQATDTVAATGAVPVYVAYNIPLRDCSGYSAGGSQSAAGYRSWIQSFNQGIGSRAAAVILEPDALALLDCLSEDLRNERLDLINYAVETMGAAGTIAVYIDAGHARWHSPEETAQRLQAAGIAGARGFSLNVSNFVGTDETVSYGEAVSALLGGKPFVVDSSRNGLGPSADSEWCNPPGRALGLPPTTNTGNPAVDGYLWLKPPGESDGTCNGGPAAGEFWTEYALGLAERADW